MPFELSTVTPEGIRFQEPVDSIVLPGTEGAFGVLPGHVRFLAPLAIGEAAVQTKGKTLYAAVSAGFAEVTQDHVVVMVDTCEFADDIDLARAQRAKAAAEAALANAKARAHENELFAREEAALERAILRIKVATDGGRH